MSEVAIRNGDKTFTPAEHGAWVAKVHRLISVNAPDVLELLGFPKQAMELRLMGSSGQMSLSEASGKIHMASLTLRDIVKRSSKDRLPDKTLSLGVAALENLSTALNDAATNSNYDGYFGGHEVLRCAEEAMQKADATRHLADIILKTWLPLTHQTPELSEKPNS